MLKMNYEVENLISGSAILRYLLDGKDLIKNA